MIKKVEEYKRGLFGAKMCKNEIRRYIIKKGDGVSKSRNKTVGRF
jgi:hypothetical protein